MWNEARFSRKRIYSVIATETLALNVVVVQALNAAFGGKSDTKLVAEFLEKLTDGD